MFDSRQPSRRTLIKRAVLLAGAASLGGVAFYHVLGHESGFGKSPSLKGRRVFPADNPWNTDVAAMPVDPQSETLLAAIGLDAPLHPDFGPPSHGVPSGIPYILVPGSQPRTVMRFDYPAESDRGQYPIPANAPIEGGANTKSGDRHILVIDRDNWKLYELYRARKENGQWHAASGAIFDLKSNALRPAGWTSADAAGLPVFPGLVRYDEAVERNHLPHALRFTARRTQHGYVLPARHYASRLRDPQLPPMGMRVRLKGNYDISRFPASARAILTALKKYGMFLADNGGNWFLSGAPDDRWDNEVLQTVRRIKGRDFEVVQMGHVVTQ